ncbi:unnamed protein product [Didymodactylos carnosus]|uniref:Uncharacterized protein n=1 Tax=Didymodactylos carnosus TaxID=1234261 RepID=A0A815PK23_9BILA|nr:unnamed protein product [Didymodactylos carnosus]CAF4324031.1 unnamed protein product [Didymodactylos carnosus]
MWIIRLFYIILLITFVESAHFNGGTVTFRPINASATGSVVSIIITQTYDWTYPLVYCDNTMIAAHTLLTRSGMSSYQLVCIANCNTSTGYTALMVQSPCTDFSVYLQTTTGQRSDTVNLVSTDHFTVAFQNAPYYAWSLYSAPALSWSIACTINVLLRPDGTINTSPKANIVSYINIPLNISYSFQIPVADAQWAFFARAGGL